MRPAGVRRCVRMRPGGDVPTTIEFMRTGGIVRE
jgi:hypothetical protein